MIVLVLALVLVVALYVHGTRRHDYWVRRGVPSERALPFVGSEGARFLQRRSAADSAARAYWRHPGARYVGTHVGTAPRLVLRDPDLVKHVLVTDFKHFTGRFAQPAHGVTEPVLRNLFFADGDLWRLLRQRMTPAFTSGKLRAMFPLIVERAERLQARTLTHAAAGRALCARDLMARYTTDFIGAVGFGLDADCLNDEESNFRKLGAKILQPSLRRALVYIAKITFPTLFKNYKFLGQELEDELVSLTHQIREQRGFRPSGRNDFIDFLLEWQDRGQLAVESLQATRADGSPAQVLLQLTDELVAAQAFIFFVAGFETSSSVTSFTLHQLAYHPEVQERACADVLRALAAHGGRLSYDAIKDMRYLEQVLMEGMRMFPSVGVLTRECVRTYRIPGSDVTIEPGVKVAVPVQAIQNDPLYFDDPEDFRPERFDPEEVAKRHKFVYLPFGDGPRACIGARMGHMQSLAGLAALLSRFSVAPAAASRRHLRVDPRSHVVQNVLGGIPLLFTERPPAPTTPPERGSSHLTSS